jgi:hypothetical protein
MNVFEEIYRGRLWGNGSGAGSDAGANAGYRRFLQSFLEENRIKSVVDFGRGDWQFSRYIDWGGARYVGLDVVPDLIEQNSRSFGTPEITFAPSPGQPEQLPEAELFIAKTYCSTYPALRSRPCRTT